jgi:hypothetical protein
MQPGELKQFVYNANPKLAVLPNCFSAEQVAVMVQQHDRASDKETTAEEMATIGNIQRILASIAGEPLEHLDNFFTAKSRVAVVPNGLSHTGDERYCEKFGGKVFFIFLTEVLENQGGELRFPRLGLQVRPRVGCAVHWTTLRSDGQRDLSTAHQPNELASGELLYAICTFCNSATNTN